MDKLILQLLALICICCLVSSNRRVVVPNPNYPSQCFDGKKAYNVGKYYPQTHRVCRQMICREDFTLLFEDCGIVEVPDGYRNVPDMTKRFPDCCVNIIKLENSTKIDANQTKIDTSPLKLDVNQTRLDANATRLDETMIKFENKTKIEDNQTITNQNNLR